MDLKEFECSSFKHAEVFTKWKNNSWRELHKKDKWKGNGVTHVKQSISIVTFQRFPFNRLFVRFSSDTRWCLLKQVTWYVISNYSEIDELIDFIARSYFFNELLLYIQGW